MSKNLGTADAPPAARATAPGWRDPRLWVGIAIVAVCVVIGASLLGSSDDTVPVWAARDAMGAGHVLTADDLAVRRVSFADDADRDLYLSADQQLPADLQLRHDVGAGELLARSAVGASGDSSYRQVPVSVPVNQVPDNVSAGTVVDIYLRPSSHTACADSPVCDGRPVLSAVTVVDAPALDQEFGSDGERKLVLGMTSQDARKFFRVSAATEDPTLTVVGRG